MSRDPERKEIHGALRELKGADLPQHGAFSARIAHIGLPPDKSAHRDVLRPGATRPQWAVFGGWNHSGMTGAMPAGKVFVHEEGGHTIADGFFFDTGPAQEMRRTMQGLGELARFSAECIVQEEDTLTPTEIAAGAGRAIKKWTIIGLAPVSAAAMPYTGLIGDVKCDRCAAAAKPAPISQAEIREMVEQFHRRQAAFVASEARDAERREQRLADARRALGCLPEVQVDAERREWAKHVVAWTAAQWGVRPPVCKWTSAAAIPRWGGVHYDRSGEVWLASSNRTEAAITKIAIHETCHHARDVRRLINTEAEVEVDTECLLPQFYRAYSLN